MFGAFDDLLSGGSSAPAAPSGSGGGSFDKLFHNPAPAGPVSSKQATPADSGGSAFDTATGVSTPPPKTKAVPIDMQTWNGQQIPANIPTKNLVSYDPATGIKSFKLPSGGVYSEDASNNLVNTGHSSYGGEPAVKGNERDDIIPVSLGGKNQDPNNIQTIPMSKAGPQDTIEKQEAADVKSGKIQPKAAITDTLAKKDAILNAPSRLQHVTDFFENIATGVKQAASFFDPNRKLVMPAPSKTGNAFKDFSENLKNSFIEAIKSTGQAVGQTAQAIAEQRQQIIDSATVKPVSDTPGAKYDAAFKTFKNLPDAVIGNLVLKPLVEFGATVAAAAKGKGEGYHFQIPLINGDGAKGIDIQDAESIYNDGIKSGLSSTDAFIRSAEQLVGNTAAAVLLAHSITATALSKFSPETLLKTVEMSRQTVMDITAGREVDPEVYQAFQELSPAQKSMAAKGLIDAMPTPKPSILGKVFGITDDQAVQLYNRVTGKTVLPTVATTKALPAGPDMPETAPAGTEAPGTAVAPTSAFDTLHAQPETPGMIPVAGLDQVHPTVEPVASTGPARPAISVAPPGITPSEPNLPNNSGGNIKPESQPAFIPSARPGEAGFIKPGEIAGDVIKAAKAKAIEVKGLIESTQKMTPITSKTSEDLFKFTQDTRANEQEVRNFLKSYNKPLPQSELAQMTHYDENKSEAISPQAKAVYDHVVVPLKESVATMRAGIVQMGGTVHTIGGEYTPHEVMGKNGAIDRLVKGTRSTVTGGGKMKASLGEKHRTFKTIIDDKGNRTLVSVKKGRVTALRSGIRQDMGPLQIRSKSELMEKEIKPLQKKLDNLQKVLDGIKSVKVFDAISKNKIINVEHELAGIFETAHGLSDTFGEKLTRQLQTRKQVLTKELKTLESVKPTDKVTNIKSRVASIQKKMVALSNAIGEVEAKYDPNQLNNKVFKAQNGQQYKMGDATIKEIEANTNVRYYKNPIALWGTKYLQTLKTFKSLQWIEAFKNTSQFKDIAIKENTGEIPANFKQTTMPQFRGYYFEPRVAEVLNDFQGQIANANEDQTVQLYQAVQSVMLGITLINPVVHTLNTGVGWAVDKNFELLNPAAYPRMIRTGIKALKGVYNLDADYLTLMKAGAPFQMLRNTNSMVTKGILETFADQYEKTPQLNSVVDKAILKAVNMVIHPVDLIKGIRDILHKGAFFGGDVMMYQAMLERMEDKGMTMEEAIKETSKYQPNYRIPSRVGDTVLTPMLGEERGGVVARGIAQLFNPQTFMGKIFVFGQYHFSGLIKPWFNTFKDIFNPKATTAERMQGVKVLLFAAMLIYGKYLLEQRLKKITKNPNTYIKSPGMLGVVDDVMRLYTGTDNAGQFIQHFLTVNPAFKSGFELISNRDSWTGNTIYGQGGEGLTQYGASALSSVGEIGNAVSGKTTVPTYLESLFGIRSPKSSPATNTLYDMINTEKPTLTNKVKDLYLQGKQAEADKLITDFNDRLYSNSVNAIKQSGYVVPSEAELDKTLYKNYMKQPTEKQLQTRQTNKKTPYLQRLFGTKPTTP